MPLSPRTSLTAQRSFVPRCLNLLLSSFALLRHAEDYVRVWLAFCHFCFRRTQAEAVVKTDADEDVVETWRMAVTGAKEYVAQYLQPETPGYNTVCLYEVRPGCAQTAHGRRDTGLASRQGKGA